MSKLFLVPTPIGNLEDITFRAIRILKEVDGILAEDTRVASRLLHHYDIKQQIQSFHQNNEHKILQSVVDRLAGGAVLALVTDAGTPGISDPGFLLVRECIREGIAVETLTGATAFVPALVNSGLPCDRFVFEGFLPHKKGRQTKLDELVEEERTVVLYESPHRILKTLKQLKERCDEQREISVSREISKMFEETVRGTISEVLHHFENNVVKGEFVIVLGGKGVVTTTQKSD